MKANIDLREQPKQDQSELDGIKKEIDIYLQDRKNLLSTVFNVNEKILKKHLLMKNYLN